MEAQLVQAADDARITAAAALMLKRRRSGFAKKFEAPASLDFHAFVLGYLDFLSWPSGNHFLLLWRLILAPLSRFVEKDVCSLFFCGTERSNIIWRWVVLVNCV